MKFIGRVQEVAAIRKIITGLAFNLLVIFGRRRVGKSALLLEALADYPHVYFQATRLGTQDNLALLREAVAIQYGDSALLGEVSTWSGFLAYVMEIARKTPGFTLVLDEFPYLCEGEPALPSVLQRACDQAKHENLSLNIIICGSKVSFMRDLLSQEQPLRGRQTMQMELAPLPLHEVSMWLPRWSDEDLIMLYALVGGVPFYLSFIEEALSLEENLLSVVFDKNSPLFEEPLILLQSELSNVIRHHSILKAIAEGCTDFGKIVSRISDIDEGNQLSPYLRKLEELHLVERLKSLDARPQSRASRYYLKDPFLSFWYRFILPYKSTLEAGYSREVYERKVAPALLTHIGRQFEKICREVIFVRSMEFFSAPLQELGAIWGRDYEIDFGGKTLDGDLIIGECKWSERYDLDEIYEDLKKKSLASAYFKNKQISHYVYCTKQRSTRVKKTAEGSLLVLTPQDLVGRS